MATRNISTKLSIQGESEYRAALSKVNSELKTLQSSLKLTESEYKNNANSMQALQAKHDALSKVVEAQKSKVNELEKAVKGSMDAQEKWKSAISKTETELEAAKKKLEDLKKSTGDTTEEQKKQAEAIAQLEKRLETEKAMLESAEKGTNKWQNELNNAKIKLNEMDAELQQNDKYLQEASKSADGCAHSIDEFGREVHEASDEVKTMASIMASREIIDFGNHLKEVLADCVRSFADFQEGMAGVRRTTGIAGPELQEMADYFKNLSTEIPITTKELTSIATTAGQLGIHGSENVRTFTEIISKLATTTDLTAESAATMLAQFANITHVTDYERLGSVVAALGDATATTATKVVEMSQGIAAAGTMAGMKERDIMAISAAVGSLGIESQAGSTAMSTLISMIYKATQTGGEKLSQFASVAGMSASQFRRAWAEDAVGALNAFITGLNDTERNGKSAMVILDDLGITNVRQTRAILGLAEAGDLLTGTIQKANQAWEENTALSEKAQIMFDTMNAHMTKLENATDNLKIAVGEALAPVLTKLIDQGRDIVKGITDFVQKHPQFTSALVTTAGGLVAVTTAIAGIKAAIKVLDFLGMTKGLEALKVAAAEAGGGMAGFGAALGTLATTAGIVGTALLSVAAVIDHFKETEKIGFLGEGHTLEEYAENVETYKQKIADLQAEYDNLAQYGGDLTMVQDALDMATIGLTNATAEYEQACEDAANAANDLADGVDNAAGSASSGKLTLDDAKYALGELAEAYIDAYNAAKESLDGQIGLFDTFKADIKEETDSAAELLNAWSEQTANLAQYTENLRKAAEYGLDNGLVSSLADGSTQSAGYLATIIQEIENCGNGCGTIATSSEEAVKKFNENFEGTAKAKESLAETMAAINTGVEDALRIMQENLDSGVSFEEFYSSVHGAFENVGIEFESLGINIGAGLKTGIEGSEPEVSSATKLLAGRQIEVMKRELSIASPSGVFKEIGQNMDRGLIEGIEAERSNVETTVQKMGDEITRIMQEAAQDATNSFVTGFQHMNTQMISVMSELRMIIISGTAGLDMSMYYVGVNIVNGMIMGIYAMSGALYAAIASVVSNAIATAEAAAAVHSPSKKTEKIFEYVGEGMIVGIEGKKEEVARATKDVVDSALVIDNATVRQMSYAFSNSLPDFDRLLRNSDRNRSNSQSSTTENQGDRYITNNFEISVATQPGQDNEEIAAYVMRYIQDEMAKDRRVFN